MSVIERMISKIRRAAGLALRNEPGSRSREVKAMTGYFQQQQSSMMCQRGRSINGFGCSARGDGSLAGEVAENIPAANNIGEARSGALAGLKASPLSAGAII
jgi:hypothetical protein